jgi:TRAP-type C4-dicarboxylate transport system substrate-binding protein
MKKYNSMFFMIVLVSAFVLVPWTQGPVMAAPITINYVNYTPEMAMPHKAWAPNWVEKINKRAKGELVVKYRGGPEVIAAFDQAKAVSKGVVDMAINPCSFFSTFVQGGDMIRLPNMTVAEQRQNGTYEWLRELYARKGLYYVGSTQPINTGYFWIVSRKPIRTKEDFKGLKIGGSPPFLPFFKRLGAVGVRATLKEYYPGVERGVFDGNIHGIDLYAVTGHFEVAPYVVDPPFYNSTTVTIMNLKKWKSLPDHLKKLIEEVQIEQERVWPAVFDKVTAIMINKAMAGGAKFIKLSPEDEKWYLEQAYYAGWAFDKKRYPPEIYNKFKALYNFKGE